MLEQDVLDRLALDLSSAETGLKQLNSLIGNDSAAIVDSEAVAIQILDVLWRLRDLGLAVHRQSDRSFWTIVVAVESRDNQSLQVPKDAAVPFSSLEQDLGCRRA